MKWGIGSARECESGIGTAARKCESVIRHVASEPESGIGTAGVRITTVETNKAKAIISDTDAELAENQGRLEHKTLEMWQAFLLYVTRMYPAIVIYYLKGIHLILNGTRHKGWDAEGWKVVDPESWEAWKEGKDTGKDQGLNGLKRVKQSPDSLRIYRH
jgi:hypothetical protein